jgi:putative SOS response-associated peptidase YedK
MNAALLTTRKPRPLACFAGVWTNWTSVRKVKEGETANDLYAFLTTEPNVEVGAIDPKAMPVILVTPEEVETWMTASPDKALKLQRPLPDGSLQIVAPGRQGRPGRAGPVTDRVDSQAGPSSRHRKVIHVDMDAFYT